MALVGHVFHVEFGLNETNLTKALEQHDYIKAETLIRNRSYSSYLDEGCYRRTPLFIVLCGVEDENKKPRIRNFYIARLLVEYGANLNHRVPETFYGCEYLSPGKTALELLVDFYNDVTHFCPSPGQSMWSYLPGSWDPHLDAVIGLNDTMLIHKSDVIEDIEQLLFILIANGSDLHLYDEEKLTSLHRTCISSDDPRIMRLLVESGANVNASDTRGNTPLVSLCDITASYLCDYFEDISPCSETVEPAILTNVKHDFLSFLLSCPDLNVNHQNHLGQTALFHCVVRGDSQSCLTLLKAGADPVIRGTVWKTRRIKRKLSPLFVMPLCLPSQRGLTLTNLTHTTSATTIKFSHLVDAGYFNAKEITSELQEMITADFPEFTHLRRLGADLVPLLFGETTRSLRQAAAAVIFTTCFLRRPKFPSSSALNQLPEFSDFLSPTWNQASTVIGDAVLGDSITNKQIISDMGGNICESDACELDNICVEESVNHSVNDSSSFASKVNTRYSNFSVSFLQGGCHYVLNDQIDNSPAQNCQHLKVDTKNCQNLEVDTQHCQHQEVFDNEVSSICLQHSNMDPTQHGNCAREYWDMSASTCDCDELHDRSLPHSETDALRRCNAHLRENSQPVEDTSIDTDLVGDNSSDSSVSELTDDLDLVDKDITIQPLSVNRRMLRDLIQLLGLPSNVLVHFDLELLHCLLNINLRQYRVLPPSGVVTDVLGFGSEEESYTDDSDSAVGQDGGDSDLEYW